MLSFYGKYRWYYFSNKYGIIKWLSNVGREKKVRQREKGYYYYYCCCYDER